MKDIFFEYYKTEDDEIKSIWEDCIFSFDTNVLLNLYRYTETTRDKFFEVLENLKEKSILTHQAGSEYHKNRLVTINSQQKAYDNLTDFFSKKCNEIENELNNYKKHSYLQTGSISKKINKTFKKLKKDIGELKKNHPDLINDDEVKDFLSDLFQGRITTEYDNERLNQIFKEGKVRYEKEIPPGYKDYKHKKGSDENSLYGDLIIWKQIIDYTKESKKPVIFVTDDLKEDWWYKFNGKTISPRPELLKEFSNETDQKILIYNADSFLSYAKEQMGADIDDEILDEIKSLRLKDERFHYSQNLKNIHKLITLQDNAFKNKINKEIFYQISKSDFKNSEYHDVYKTFIDSYLSKVISDRNIDLTEDQKKAIYQYLVKSENISDKKRMMLFNFFKKYKDDFNDDDFEEVE